MKMAVAREASDIYLAKAEGSFKNSEFFIYCYIMFSVLVAIASDLHLYMAPRKSESFFKTSSLSFLKKN